MSDHHTYKILELVGSSTTGTDDAIQHAIGQAAKTMKHLEWFEVLETRGHIENGKVANLDYSRFWAQKQGKTAKASPGNLLMSGGDKSTAELVRGTQKGILVTRTWYIRMVDPQTVLLTGLTRDGTFYIENGKIKYPIKNFRFNESPVTMLNNIEEIGKPVIIGGDEVPYQMSIPPMKVRDFNFTSLSDAV